MTKRWQIRPEDANIHHPVIQEAAELMRAGKQVAFPTETVYGLGADATNTEAVDGIFQAKGRPSDNPLIIHIADRSQLDDLTDHLDEISLRLMDAFWPGPLTIVLPVIPGAVSSRVTAGLSTVAVRMPDHPVALALIAAAGCPVAAPSANRSGRPSPTRASHVLEDLDGAIAGIVDGGPTGVGIESTVVEVTEARVHILRPGGVSADDICQALPGVQVTSAAEWLAGEEPRHASVDGKADGAVSAGAAVCDDRATEAVSTGEQASAGATCGEEARHANAECKARALGAVSTGDAARFSSLDDSSAQPTAAERLGAGRSEQQHAPKSPGMKYAHYAPRGLLTVVRAATPERMMSWINQDIMRAQAAGERTGVLTCTQRAEGYRADVVLACGSERDAGSLARGLYDALRRFDEAGITYILAEAVDESGIGAAVMNRLRKAAGGRMVTAEE